MALASHIHHRMMVVGMEYHSHGGMGHHAPDPDTEAWASPAAVLVSPAPAPSGVAAAAAPAPSGVAAGHILARILGNLLL